MLPWGSTENQILLPRSLVRLYFPLRMIPDRDESSVKDHNLRRAGHRKSLVSTVAVSSHGCMGLRIEIPQLQIMFLRHCGRRNLFRRHHQPFAEHVRLSVSDKQMRMTSDQ